MILVLILAAVAAVYQLLALVAALRHLARKEPLPSALPPISILKPVRGLAPHFYDAIRSHALQDYPDFEILFGIADPCDPARRRPTPEKQPLPGCKSTAIPLQTAGISAPACRASRRAPSPECSTHAPKTC